MVNNKKQQAVERAKKKVTADKLKADNAKQEKEKAIAKEEAAKVAAIAKKEVAKVAWVAREQEELEKSNLAVPKKEG